MKSPFKFLDAYTLEDKDVFFGREEELNALYDMVNKNRLILVYGQTGTGKTSLIQCGLASRFDITDWYPLFIRRQNDLNLSLRTQLSALSAGDAQASVPEMLEDIYMNFLRPVYLIFDQMEELFILGTAEEAAQFIKTIQSILNTNLPCRILFVIREEYLAYLYSFELTLPTLFDRRLRVEPMSIAKVNTVLKGSFNRFNIKVQAPAEETLVRIVNNVSGGRTGIQLPYLQVYLDMLYREDFSRTYPQQENPAGNWLPLEFTRKEIDALGRIDNVLEQFLREQKNNIQANLQKRFPDLPEDTVQKVLDAFVSEDGTKRPVEYHREGENLHVESHWEPLFAPLSPDILYACCSLLEQARLLRFSDRYIELAHDSLAALIDNQRSNQQRRLQEATLRLLNNYREFRDTGEYLTRRQLNYYEDLWPLIETRLDASVKEFVAESAKKVQSAEQTELENERNKRKRARRIAVFGLMLAAVALIGFATAWLQYRAANRAKIEITRNALEARRNIAQTLKVEGKYEEAIGQLTSITSIPHALSAGEQDDFKNQITRWTQLRALMLRGDSLVQQAKFRNALATYKEAQQLDSDTYIDNRVLQTGRDLENAYHDYLIKGEALYNAKRYDQAIEFFNKALDLKPGDAVATQKLEKTKG